MNKLLITALLSAVLLPDYASAQCDDRDLDFDGQSCIAGDCNDNDNSIYLGAPELCDNKDNDCDTIIDNPPDGDGDGFNLCQGDCDDGDNQRYPGNTEICDGKDNDCDPGTLDSSLNRSCYTGPSGTNGRGLCHGGTETCNGTTWPGTCAGEVTPTPEQCDNQDHDCDGNDLNGIPDGDNDGVVVCFDCDDGDGDRYPGNTEICDGKDNDCDPGTLDTNLTQSCYDGPSGTNGVGICHGGTRTCNGTNWSGPCVGQQLPEPEQCDTVDHDCDNDPLNGMGDNDGDGVAYCFDCDDNDIERYPGNTEICDGKDNDCDPGTLDSNLTRSCYDGPSGTRGRGICHGGTEDCNGTAWTGTCNGQQLPQTEQCDTTDHDCDGDNYNGFQNLDNDPFPLCAGDCDDNDPDRFPGNPEVCDGKDNDCNGLVDEDFDIDGDTWTTCGGDCDDSNPFIYPGAPEACNGLDDDCDNLIDEDFPDADGDGHRPCGPNPDCDDNNNQVYPGRNEQCNGIDDDCDNLTDERNNSGAPLRRGCYTGPSGTNGVGECHGGLQECLNGTFTGNPCNNEQTPVAEQCNFLDDNCDTQVDEDFDQDNDNFVTCGPTPDCDDNNNQVYPGATEVCNGVDDDCNSATQDANMTRDCYTGPSGTEGVGVCVGGHNECLGQPGWGTACVDEVTPSTNEPCDGLDNNCNNQVDEGFDLDNDSFTTCGGDCDDTDPDVNPNALEICNNIDDDCDNVIDGNRTACYTGPAGTSTVGICHPGSAICINGQPDICENEQIPETEVCDLDDNNCNGEIDEGFDQDVDGVTTCGGDCDDTNPFIAEGMVERCDCQDNDCDTEIDEDGRGGTVCEFGACHDFDADGFTNCDGDCDDYNASAYPGAAEQCPDNIDNDCDGLTDEDVDEDGDNFTTCEGDCDDRFAAIHPMAPEVCDGFDNNCEGTIDEGYDTDGDFATVCAGDCDDNDPTRSPFRREVCGNNIDDDCDGVTDPDDDFDGDTFTICDGDCNDYNAVVYPGAPEICDGHDNDCNNQVDEGFDQDNDTFATCFGDCDDTNPDIGPFAREVVDGIDNNCNDQIDEGQEDNDNDGFSYLCGDCNDGNAAINPHSPDVCDGRDNDCDGRIDIDTRGESTCSECNDVDQDNVTDCEGDCNDADPDINPNATEVCDGIDNDCDLTIDLDPATGNNLCIINDAGTSTNTRPDSGTTTSDGGSEDVPDAGAVDPINLHGAPVEINCGCSSVEQSPSRSLVWILLLLGLFFFIRHGRGLAKVFLLVLLAGCTTFEVGGEEPTPRDAGPFVGDGAPLDGAEVDGGQDAGSGDVKVGDLGPIDLGPLTEGDCRLVETDRISMETLPGRQFQIALHKGTAASPLTGANGLSMDDDLRGLRGFAMSVPLPPMINPRDALAASDYIDQFVDPLFSQGLPGVTGVATRVDETLKQTLNHRGRPATRTLRKITMVNDVLPSAVRTAILAELAQVPIQDLGGIPPAMGEVPTRDLALTAFAVVDEFQNAVNIVVALSNAEQFPDLAAHFADLTNGTHVGGAGAPYGIECENDVAQALSVDFLWVVDNSASMQEEQQALALAADTFFEALQRSQIDFRVGVVTTDGEALRGGSFTRDVAEFRNRVQVGINGNGREQGLEFAVRAVERAATATATEERLRLDAVTVVVFFSDEDATNLRSTAEYITALHDFDVIAFAVVGPRPRGCLAIGRGIARVGENYISVVEGLGGTSASICSDDLTAPVEEILIAAAGAASQTQLEGEPISGSIELALPTSTVARNRQNGFDYEPTANSIVFFGQAVPVGTDFRVTYLTFLPFVP